MCCPVRGEICPKKGLCSELGAFHLVCKWHKGAGAGNALQQWWPFRLPEVTGVCLCPEAWLGSEERNSNHFVGGNLEKMGKGRRRGCGRARIETFGKMDSVSQRASEPA